MTDEGVPVSYTRRVGERLRAIRRQKGLSLHEVEKASGHEFKASVLGAYERGERAISVPRLQRLAGFYSVPVDQLLPADVDIDLTPGGQGPTGEDPGRRRSRSPGGTAGTRTVTIDLMRLEGLHAPEAETLHRYAAMIQRQRQDFNGRVLTVRAEDLRTIACVLGTDLTHMVERLDELGLRVAV